MRIGVFSHSALNAKIISEIYFVHARFSSSADKPGNLVLNSCLSNPGMQAMSASGVFITVGSVTTATFFSDDSISFNTLN